VREFFYGLIIGAALLYGWEKVDVPTVWRHLTGLTDYAVQSTEGYQGKYKKRW